MNEHRRARNAAGRTRPSAWAGMALLAALSVVTLVVVEPAPTGATTRAAAAGSPSDETSGSPRTPLAALPLAGDPTPAVRLVAAPPVDAPDEFADAADRRRARPGSEACYRAAFLKLRDERGVEAMQDAVSATLATPLPDVAKVAGLKAALEAEAPAALDLLAQAVVAPAVREARGRLSLAEWAADRLMDAAVAESRARELLLALVDGTVPTHDRALRRRAATALARWSTHDELDLLARAGWSRADPLFEASVRSGLERRPDADLLRGRLPWLMGDVASQVAADASSPSHDDSLLEP